METIFIGHEAHEVPDIPMRDTIAAVTAIAGKPVTLRYDREGRGYTGRNVFETCPFCGTNVLVEVWRDADETALAAECKCGARINFERWEENNV